MTATQVKRKTPPVFQPDKPWRYNLEVWLNSQFKTTLPSRQWQDDHIWVDLIGRTVVVWNALNMRYQHRRFDYDFSQPQVDPMEEAYKYFTEEYRGQPMEVPEKYAVA